jgi:hypothetical protein
MAKYPVTIQNSSNLGTIGACAPVPAQTQSAVQAYCTSAAYTGSTRFLRYKENLEEILKEEKLKAQGGYREEETEGLSVFPNPAKEKVTLKYRITSLQHVKVEVKDVVGRTLVVLADHQTAPGKYEIELFTTQFAAGTYFIFFESTERRQVKQLVVQK